MNTCKILHVTSTSAFSRKHTFCRLCRHLPEKMAVFIAIKGLDQFIRSCVRSSMYFYTEYDQWHGMRSQK